MVLRATLSIIAIEHDNRDIEGVTFHAEDFGGGAVSLDCVDDDGA